MKYQILFALLCISACTQIPPVNSKVNHPFKTQSRVAKVDKWAFSKVANSKLIFKNGKYYNTGLHDLHYIGQIENGGKAPFLIFSGKDCTDCDENISIYIHSPDAEKLKIESGQNRYQYPGIEKDYESNTVLYKAQAYYGEVLPHVKGVIWYQNQLLQNGKYQKSIFIATCYNSKVKDTTLIINNRYHITTLKYLYNGSCKEIKGNEYTSEP